LETRNEVLSLIKRGAETGSCKTSGEYKEDKMPFHGERKAVGAGDCGGLHFRTSKIKKGTEMTGSFSSSRGCTRSYKICEVGGV